jgi:hypothetical protein
MEHALNKYIITAKNTSLTAYQKVPQSIFISRTQPGASQSPSSGPSSSSSPKSDKALLQYRSPQIDLLVAAALQGAPHPLNKIYSESEENDLHQSTDIQTQVVRQYNNTNDIDMPDATIKFDAHRMCELYDNPTGRYIDLEDPSTAYTSVAHYPPSGNGLQYQNSNDSRQPSSRNKIRLQDILCD